MPGLWICMSSYRFDRLLKMPPVLNKPGFWIWHGCIYKGYAEFRIYLIMASYTSITPEYTSIWPNTPQYTWTWLNIPECPWIYEYTWINCPDHARFLNMPRYSYNCRFSYGENWEVVKSIVGTKFRRSHVCYILKREIDYDS